MVSFVPFIKMSNLQVWEIQQFANVGILPREAVLRLQKALANSYTPEIMALLIKDMVRMSFYFYTTYTLSTA